jgi:mRNA-degrading endonuclease RelE of RelBE toxin-antitoxin system
MAKKPGVTVRPRPEVSQDLKDLPSDDLRREALREIVEIRDHPFRSKPLERRVTGDLGDCRKKYFHHARYRVIYRLLPDESNPIEADVITVGPRAGRAVYKEALIRLGR